MGSIIYLLLLSLCNVITAEAANDTVYWNYMSNQKDLMHTLFYDYSNEISAVYYTGLGAKNAKDGPYPMNITVQIMYLKLIRVSEPEEKVTFIIEFETMWQDPRLKWDPIHHGNISTMFAPRSKVWIPQFHIVNTHDVVDYRPEYQQVVQIFSDGRVNFHQSQVASVVCPMNVTCFPFDSQRCEIMLISNHFRLGEISVKLHPYDIKRIPRDLGTGEWTTLQVKVEREIVPLEDRDVELNMYIIEIKRNSAFYVSMIIIPAFIINTLSVLGMFITKGDRMGKLTIALTNLMSMTFILGILTEAVPKTKDIPLLGVYVIVNLMIVLAAVMFTIVVPLFYMRYFKDFSSRHKDSSSPVKYEVADTQVCRPSSGATFFLRDKCFWNRVIFLLLETANFANFAYLFVGNIFHK